MFITIPPWDVLVAAFGLDSDGDIGNHTKFYWTMMDETLLPSNRIVEIEDTPDEDGDYRLVGYYKDPNLPEEKSSFILSELFALCSQQSNYGTSKFLRRPYATD